MTDRFSCGRAAFQLRPHASDRRCISTGDKAYVLANRLGYGVWTEKLGVVDLKTRASTAPLNLPAQALQHPYTGFGPGRHTVFLASYERHRISRSTLSRQTVTPPRRAERYEPTVGNQLLGMWQGKALLFDRETLRPGSDARTYA